MVINIFLNIGILLKPTPLYILHIVSLGIFSKYTKAKNILEFSCIFLYASWFNRDSNAYVYYLLGHLYCGT